MQAASSRDPDAAVSSRVAHVKASGLTVPQPRQRPRGKQYNLAVSPLV